MEKDQATYNKNIIKHDCSKDKKQEETNVKNVVLRQPKPDNILHKVKDLFSRGPRGETLEQYMRKAIH